MSNAYSSVQGEGGGQKISEMMRTYYMDGPLYSVVYIYIIFVFILVHDVVYKYNFEGHLM